MIISLWAVSFSHWVTRMGYTIGIVWCYYSKVCYSRIIRMRINFRFQKVWYLYYCMSLSRDRIIYSFCPNVKIKMPTSRFVRDKKYKGFSKLIMEKKFKKFQIWNPFLEAKEAFLRVMSLLRPPHICGVFGGS